MFWFQQGMCFLPAFLVVSSSTTFIVCYVIAVLRSDVDVIFPYISDTGATPPESCLFGLMTSLTTFTAWATMYSRYCYVERLRADTARVSACLNRASYCTGLVACLGMCVVGTFQETAVRWVHELGALLFFAGGVLYAVLETVVSYRALPHGSPRAVCHARAALATAALLVLFPTVIFALMVKDVKMHRNKHDGYYMYHLISAICEWIISFNFVFFFLTYIHDFKFFTLRVTAEI